MITITTELVSQIVSTMNLEIRPYQLRIVEKIAKMFAGQYVDQHGNEVGLISSVQLESPTGSGKTVMGLIAAKLAQLVYPDAHVVWVGMRRFLLHQAERANIEKGINVQNIHFVSMFDSYPEEVMRAKARGCKIITVSDESQHDAASSMTNLHTLVDPDFILGLTATPFRTDKMRLCFQMVVKDAGIHRLISDGYLSKFDHYTIPNWKPETVVDTYCLNPKQWGKSVFYFVSLPLCYAARDLLLARGHRCDVVTGETDCDTQIKRFEAGEYDCLINCMKLTEGFDCPSLQTVWVRDSSKGPTMQMGGRVLRLFGGLRKNVVQSLDTKYVFTKVAKPVDQYTLENNQWKSLKPNENLDKIATDTIIALIDVKSDLPDFIKLRRTKSKKARSTVE